MCGSSTNYTGVTKSHPLTDGRTYVQVLTTSDHVSSEFTLVDILIVKSITGIKISRETLYWHHVNVWCPPQRYL